jgi:hypothetical protein
VSNLYSLQHLGLWRVIFVYRRVLFVREVLTFSLVFAVLTGGIVSASAAPGFDLSPNLAYARPQNPTFQGQPSQPYAMNYSDEIAQTLGVQNGRWDAFDTGPSRNIFVPSLSGGVDRGGAMIKLQWRPGL